MPRPPRGEREQEVWLREYANSFAVSEKGRGHFVGHVHWQGQQTLGSWADIEDLWERSGSVLFFTSAEEYGVFVGMVGAPPTRLTRSPEQGGSLRKQ